MTERRYSEDEVAAIFERAAEAEATGSGVAARGDGRTLAELKAIGAEAGLPPELVARAAESLGRAGEPEIEPFLGFPLAVGRTVELGRTVSEEEWARLVGDLRMTFNAQGRVRVDGPYRQWSNGNLRAVLEPTETGDRLRLHTMKGNARTMMTGGLFMIAMALALLLASLAAGESAGEWSRMLLIAAVGAGAFGFGALQVPGWAATRIEQMGDVAARLDTSSSADSDASAVAGSEQDRRG